MKVTTASSQINQSITKDCTADPPIDCLPALPSRVKIDVLKTALRLAARIGVSQVFSESPHRLENNAIQRLRKMLSMERIPDQRGYLVLTEDGAVLTSGGELENDERVANIVRALVKMTDKIDPEAFAAGEAFNKIAITYDDHCYVICFSNKKIHVVKKKLTTSALSSDQQQSITT